MKFRPDARVTEYFNLVPVGTEFQNEHKCEACWRIYPAGFFKPLLPHDEQCLEHSW